jgi:thioredoxin-like negative regulator of GroEL
MSTQQETREVRDGVVQHGTAAESARQDARIRLVFFTDRDSGECRRAEGWIAQVLQHRRNHLKVKLVTVDRASRPDLVERFAVDQFPTLVVVDEDRVARRLLERPRGARPIQELLEPWLR